MNTTYREDIRDLLSREMKRYTEVGQGLMFGFPGWHWQRRFFAMPYEDGLVLKLSKSDYEEALKLPEAEPFSPMPGRPMATWVVISYPDVESYTTNWHWIDKAYRYVQSDEGAPVKNRKNRTNRGI